MILSRLYLNPAHRYVQRCLSDAQELHRRVLSLFQATDDEPQRSTLGILHRLEVSEREGLITLLIQSRDELPNTASLPDFFLDPRLGEVAFASTDLEPLVNALSVGRRCRFRLRANPTRRILTKSGSDGKRTHGKRVPLHDDATRFAWLERKLLAAGLGLVDSTDVRQTPQGRSMARRRGGVATHDAHTFDGIAKVLDTEAVERGLRDGIGPAKAYGFGLLSLALLEEA